MVVAPVPWLNFGLTGVERFKALLYPAMDQVLEFRTRRIPHARTALALALPDKRPGVHAGLGETLLGDLVARYPATFVATAAFPNGHAAGAFALSAGMRKLTRGDVDACVLAGVDSYIEPETLEWLESCDQLHGGGESNNAWGFIPGEGAGAILIVGKAVAEQVRGTVLAHVAGIGTAKELCCIKTDTVCVGKGLTDAFRAALQPLTAGEVVTDMYCDMNGEPYRADEYGFTALRTKEYFTSLSGFVAPADCWGDVAAASVPLNLSLASIAGMKGYSNGLTALVWGSSEGGERGATLLFVQRGEGYAGNR